MDFLKMKNRISTGVAKYKYVWAILLIGVVLMMWPEEGDGKPVPEVAQNEAAQEEGTLEKQLEEMLSCLENAGCVRVMLTVAQGERTIYQTDSTYLQNENQTDTRTQTILITDGQRNETGLIHQINPPIYLGAIVLAQGADDPVVKLAIVEAVSDVTGLGTDKISVLKMQ